MLGEEKKNLHKLINLY